MRSLPLFDYNIALVNLAVNCDEGSMVDSDSVLFAASGGAMVYVCS